MRLAAKILDENPKIGMVYPLGEYVGDRRGPWLSRRDIRDVLLEEGVPSCSMYRKEIWRQVGGYHDYMYHGSEDWDFTLCVLKRGWQLACLEGSVGVYYRVKEQSRSRQAVKRKYELAAHIYRHHRDLFQQHNLIQTVFRESYLYRKHIRSDVYRAGYAIVGPVKNTIIALRKMIYKLKKRFRPRRAG